MFGMYFVGHHITFDVYRVVDNKKTVVTFKEIDYTKHPRCVLRAILAIKVQVQIIIGLIFLPQGMGQFNSRRFSRDQKDFQVCWFSTRE